MAKGSGGTRGASGGARAKASGFQGDASMKGYSAALAKAVSERESQIRNNDYYEAGTVYDENGNVIYNENRGNNGSVYLGADQENRIITHNHPIYGKGGGKPRADEGGSLSRGDIMNAHDYNSKEVRAVTRHYTYSLKRPAEGWHKGWVGDKFYGHPANAYKRAKSIIDKADKKYFQNYIGDKSQASRRMSATYWHRVNKEFARIQGYDYSKTRVN